MRIIKFRAWNGLKMEYDVVVGKLGAFHARELDPKDTASISPFNTIYDEQTPIMQFTGLKDKDGKEIYEGDVVKTLYDDMSKDKIYPKTKCIVRWSENEVGFQIDDKGDGYWEIIGNIYENPDLLSKK